VISFLIRVKAHSSYHIDQVISYINLESHQFNRSPDFYVGNQKRVNEILTFYINTKTSGDIEYIIRRLSQKFPWPYYVIENFGCQRFHPNSVSQDYMYTILRE